MLQHVKHVQQVFQCLGVQKKLVDCGLLGEDLSQADCGLLVEDLSQADTMSNVAY